MPDDENVSQAPSRSADEIAEWLRVHLAGILKCSPDDIDITAPVSGLALDSATAVGVTLDLEDWLGRPVEPAAFFDYTTISELAQALASGVAEPGSQNPP